MKTFLIFFIFSFSGCSQADITLEANCYQDENRKVEEELQNHKGTIVVPNENSCHSLYTIKDETKNYLLNLAPCNLPDSFKRNELKIIFSGKLFETFETEDICALPFELMDIKKDE